MFTLKVNHIGLTKVNRLTSFVACVCQKGVSSRGYFLLHLLAKMVLPVQAIFAACVCQNGASS